MKRRERRSEDGVETLRGNYLHLTPEEAEAIVTYTSGSQKINMLFNTDISSILPRLNHWKLDPKTGMPGLNEGVVNTILNLYRALLKAQTYHSSIHQFQDHPYKLWRGTRGRVHSVGFKSFSQKRDIALSFASSISDSYPGTIIDIPFPKDVPFLSTQDLFNYSPEAKRHEEEYLFDPFTEIKSDTDPYKALFGRSIGPRKYEIVSREFQYSLDNLPDDINENLSQMAELLKHYAEVVDFISECQRNEGYRKLHQSEYEKALKDKSRIHSAYEQLAQQVLNYIEYECSKIKQKYDAEQNSRTQSDITEKRINTNQTDGVVEDPKPRKKRKIL